MRTRTESSLKRNNIKVFTFSFIVFLVYQPVLFSQESQLKFGQVNMNEMEMANYEKDPDAEALILFDIGESRFVQSDRGFDLVFTRTKRIKIFTDAGLEYAEIEIPLYHDGESYEVVEEIKGYTYTIIDGSFQQSELDASESFDEIINDHWKLKKIVLPNVQAGSVIEYRYKIRSDFIFNLYDWEFQARIPTVTSEYTVKMIPFYTYTYILQGARSFDYQNSYQDLGFTRQFGDAVFSDMINVYRMNDVPAFRGEEYITSINDYIIKMDFQLSQKTSTAGVTIDIMTTWEEMCKEYLKSQDFGKYINRSENLYSKVFALPFTEGQNKSETAYSIVAALKQIISWNGFYGKNASCSPKTLLDRKTGNVAEINLFLIGMLRAAGLDAHPLLLSTRDHGKLHKAYPFSQFLNYVIAAVSIDDGYILLDATDPFCSNKRIPKNCINELGIVFNRDRLEWVKLEYPQVSERSYFIKMRIDEDDLLHSTVNINSNEYCAQADRKRISGDADELKKNLDNLFLGAKVDQVKIENYREIGLPFVYGYGLESNIEKIAGSYYVSPFLIYSLSENPFKQNTRNHPIDMIYPERSIFQTAIEIPDGYQVGYLPDKQKISNDLFEMEYEAVLSGNIVLVRFQYCFLKSVYPSRDYVKLKYYFNELVKKSTDHIILSEI